MRAVLITFASSVPLAEVHEAFLTFTDAVATSPGLLTKTWLAGDGRLGGFYLFANEAAAQAYLEGPIMVQSRAVPAFSDWQIQQFDVAETLSAHTHGLPAAVIG